MSFDDEVAVTMETVAAVFLEVAGALIDVLSIGTHSLKTSSASTSY